MDRDSVEALLDGVLARVYTTLPGKVEKVYTKGSTTVVDVKPAVNYYLNDGNAQEEQVLKGIPMCWSGGGGAYLTFDLQPGDLVEIVFSMRSLHQYRNSDGVKPVTPVFKTLHDINHAYVRPGMSTYLNGATHTIGETTLGNSTTQIHIKRDGTIVIGGSEGTPVMHGTNLMEYLTTVVTALNTLGVTVPLPYAYTSADVVQPEGTPPPETSVPVSLLSSKVSI